MTLRAKIATVDRALKRLRGAMSALALFVVACIAGMGMTIGGSRLEWLLFAGAGTLGAGTGSITYWAYRKRGGRFEGDPYDRIDGVPHDREPLR